MRKLIVPVLLLGAFAVIASAEEKPTSSRRLAAAVEANMKTPEGKAYDAQFSKELMDKYLPMMKDCKAKAGSDLRDFDILVRVEKDGSVKEVLLYRPTKMSECMRGPLLKAVFSPPPKPAHWVDIHMVLKH